MSRVQFTSNLKRFYPDLDTIEVSVQNVSELIEIINRKFPGIKSYIVDDQDTLRHHVNIFINDTMIKDRKGLQDMIEENDSVFIMQALSGG